MQPRGDNDAGQKFAGGGSGFATPHNLEQLSWLEEETLFPSCDQCPACCGKWKPSKDASSAPQVAVLWTGVVFGKVQHGRLRCRNEGCGATIRLNYYTGSKKKGKEGQRNYVKKENMPKYVLLSDHFGSTSSFMAMLPNRMFRSAGTSFTSDSCVALLTYPELSISEKGLAGHEKTLFFYWAALEEKLEHFEIQDPFSSVASYDEPNVGDDCYVIFDVWRDDPDTAAELEGQVLDTNADGNLRCCRKTQDDEKEHKTRGIGRPKLPKDQKSRCQAVSKQERQDDKFRDRTEGRHYNPKFTLDPRVLH